MPWMTLDPDKNPGHATTVLWCVRLGAATSKEHARAFGITSAVQRKSRDRLCAAMKPVADGTRYVQISYRDDYKNGEVAVFFQKMKWMSAYNAHGLGNQIWVMSIVFEQDGGVVPKPNVADDTEYFEFLDMLNEPGGPVQQFLSDQRISSLFSVDPARGNAPDRNREISRLEYLVRNRLWTPQKGTWKYEPRIPVGSTYRGSNGQLAPAGMRRHWGCGGVAFDLTEIKFTP
jgi:hypothetical protein